MTIRDETEKLRISRKAIIETGLLMMPNNGNHTHEPIGVEDIPRITKACTARLSALGQRLRVLAAGS